MLSGLPPMPMMVGDLLKIQLAVLVQVSANVSLAVAYSCKGMYDRILSGMEGIMWYRQSLAIGRHFANGN
jgi:hypothetical protein